VKATGFSARIKRKSLRRKLLPKSSTEEKYVRGLKEIASWVSESYMNFLTPRLASVARADGKHSTDLQFLFATVKIGIRQKLVTLFNSMASDIEKQEGAVKLLGIDPRTLGITHIIDHFRDENILLVENAARVYADNVRKVMDDPEAHLLRVEELKQKLLDLGDVSKSRAELIARDQTLKLAGQINKSRQTRAGVTEYVWSTSGDERVRPEHAALDGRTFSWDDPVGGEAPPGSSFQCRCVAVPVIPELDD
jgi:SPP1 gp7 family putative phage head morphogenesis protein